MKPNGGRKWDLKKLDQIGRNAKRRLRLVANQSGKVPLFQPREYVIKSDRAGENKASSEKQIFGTINKDFQKRNFEKGDFPAIEGSEDISISDQ